jgi:hypothetical protein
VPFPDSMFYGPPLLRIQPIEVREAHGGKGMAAGPVSEADSCFVRNLPLRRPALGAPQVSVPVTGTKSTGTESVTSASPRAGSAVHGLAFVGRVAAAVSS